MSIEVCHGHATAIVKTKDQKSSECLVGEHRVRLHPDLERHVGEGDEIVVAGELNDGLLQAVALRNVTRHRSSQADGSNYTLLFGAGIFLWILGFVLSMQYLGIADTTLASLNAFISICGLMLSVWAAMRVLRIRRAGLRASYGNTSRP